MTSALTVVWEAIGDRRGEIAHVELDPPVRARGTQIGVGYRADYELEAQPACVTRSLVVEVAGGGWRRRLELRHDGEGAWSCEVEQRGDADLPPAGGAVEELVGALDCDLALSPLTNFMPVVREGLHRAPGTSDFLMAWVSLPGLGVHASRQRYEHVAGGEHPVVRYSDPEVSAALVLDSEGLVVTYPGLARRVATGVRR